MNNSDKPSIVALPVVQPPMPIRHVIFPKEGQFMLAGELTPVMASHKLDTAGMPPSCYQAVRDDITKLASIPCTRIALLRRDHAYVGIIDSDSTPHVFVLSSEGLVIKPALNVDKAWAAFDDMMTLERASALAHRRLASSREMLNFVVKATKPYGHTAYTRHTKTGKLVNVKAKGVKPIVLDRHEDSHGLAHDRNPFERNVEFKDEHDVWNILNAARIRHAADAHKALRPHMKRLFGVSSRTHDVDEAIRQVVDQLHAHKVFSRRKFQLKAKKEPAQKPKTEPSWADTAAACERVVRAYHTKKQPTAADMRLVRDRVRSVLEAQEINTARSSGRPRSHMIRVDGRLGHGRGQMAGVAAYHTWEGEVRMSLWFLAGMADFCTNMAKVPPTMSPELLKEFTIAVHEELHGCSPIDASAYHGHGIIIEEVTTELAARDVVMKSFGHLKNHSAMPSLQAMLGTFMGHPNFTAYNHYIAAVHHSVGNALSLGDNTEIAKIMATASRAVKASKTICTSPGELLWTFALEVAKAAGRVGDDAYTTARILDSQIRSIDKNKLDKMRKALKVETGILSLRRNDVKAALAVRARGLRAGTWRPEDDRTLLKLQDNPDALLDALAQTSVRKADRLPGGKADKKKPSDFDADALAEGTKHEMEHTNDRKLAREIAMDHLTEDTAYYVKLKKLEKAKQPYGHTAYTRRTKTGKLVNVRAKGVKPTTPSRVPAPAPRSAKSLAALAAHNPFTQEKEAWATRNEQEITKRLRGESTRDNLPVDTIVKLKGKVKGIEVKTMLDNKAGKITMRDDAVRRKVRWAARNHASLHTIVIDDRDRFGNPDMHSGHRLYYKKGVGSFRISTMIPVRDTAHLLQLLGGS